LLLALASAVAAAFLTPSHWPISVRMAISWDCGVVIFLALTWWLIRQCPKDDMRETVLANDQGRPTILILVLLAGAASIASIFFLLQKQNGVAVSAANITLAVGTIVCSWLFTHVMFALHYAHLFYRDDPATKEDDATGGLDFPGGDAPDYWDFLYVSFVIGMTFQVSDVQVTSRGMRRFVLGHSALAFFFYTVVLALSINIVAGLV
jgi:uncharacterized membrane protein